MKKKEEKKENDETMRGTDWGILMIAPPVIVWEVLRDYGKLRGKKLWLTWISFWIVLILSLWIYIKIKI
jgi:hypothetical protein